MKIRNTAEKEYESNISAANGGENLGSVAGNPKAKWRENGGAGAYVGVAGENGGEISVAASRSRRAAALRREAAQISSAYPSAANQCESGISKMKQWRKVARQ